MFGLAGLRIGYGIGPEPLIALLQRVRQPFNVNAMAQQAALAALADDAYVARTRKMIQEGLAYLAGELSRLQVEQVPSVTNFLLARVGRGREVFQALLREKVIVRPMDVYGLPDYVRITVGTAGQNQALVRGLERVLPKR
jgi:histidinol-phosphate aminotransferase